MRQRLPQVVLIITFIGFSWLMMQIVHESGHVLLGLATGGKIQGVILHPLAFSRTDVSPNPHPLLVVWGGPVLGVALPLLFWIVAHHGKRKAFSRLARFFAGFCCIANGVYVGFGPASEGLDTEVMLKLGCQRWQLLLFGIPIAAAGLWLWHGTGRAFGLGRPREPVRIYTAVVSAALLVMVIATEIVMSRSFLP